MDLTAQIDWTGMCCLNKQAKTEQAAVIFGLMRTKAHVHFITEPNQTKAASAVEKQLFAWEGSRDKEWRSRSQHMLSQTREELTAPSERPESS